MPKCNCNQDHISCDCDHSFHTLTSSAEKRYINCPDCGKKFRVGLSGKRLYDVEEESK